MEIEPGLPVLLEIHDLEVAFPLPRGKTHHAVVDMSFSVYRGETLGLVGESGCGKSSLARAMMQLPPPTAGKVVLCGEDLTRVSGQRLRQLRPKFQMVFQNSLSSLNPRRKIGDTLAIPLTINQKTKISNKKQQILEMMALVGLDPDLFHRRPHELSGGQCQRVQIARALMTGPDLIILDEPVSSLDASVQAKILNLLEKLRTECGLTLFFISHDLALVKNVCDRVMVMYGGRLCELAASSSLYKAPAHPYTRILMDAVPRPNPFDPPPSQFLGPEEAAPARFSGFGCRFSPRCPRARSLCEKKRPGLEKVGQNHWAACHFTGPSRLA